MEYVRAARLLGLSAKSYTAELAPLVADLADALLDVLLVSLRLLSALSRPLLALLHHVLHLLGPPLSAATAALWSVFLRQSPEALALEAAGGCALLLCALLEARFGVLRAGWAFCAQGMRGVARWYHVLRRGVREKSRLAGLLMSHVVFVAPVLVGCFWVGNGKVGGFVKGYGMFFASCVLPVFQSARVLYRMEDLEAENDRGMSVGDGMEDYWSESEGEEMEEDHALLTEGNRRQSESGSVTADQGGREVDAMDSQAARPPSSGASGLRKRRRLSVRQPPQSPSTVRTSSSGRQLSLSVRSSTTPVRSRRDTASAERQFRAREAALLRFWSVFGVVWAARLASRYFSPALLSPLHDRADTFVFFFLIWLQTGLTRGADVLFPVLASALRQGHHLRSKTSAGAEQFNVFLRVLVSIGMVPAERAAVVSSTLSESGVVLVGIVFFITPRPVTYLGTLLTGYAVPVYLTVAAAAPSGPLSTRQTWLSYWTACTVIEAMYAYLSAFDWMPLWYHAKLALVLWLQVPYYRGASFLLDAAMERWGQVLSKVRSKPVTPKKRRL